LYLGDFLSQIQVGIPTKALLHTADVLEMLAKQGKVVMPGDQDPTTAVAEVAAELRAVGVSSEQLARDLADPASALFLMGGP